MSRRKQKKNQKNIIFSIGENADAAEEGAEDVRFNQASGELNSRLAERLATYIMPILDSASSGEISLELKENIKSILLERGFDVEDSELSNVVRIAVG